jgi:hypothetical protein
VTGGPKPGCACAPSWSFLMVRTEAGDVTVEPTATPGGQACPLTGALLLLRGDLPGPSGCRPVRRSVGHQIGCQARRQLDPTGVQVLLPRPGGRARRIARPCRPARGART